MTVDLRRENSHKSEKERVCMTIHNQAQRDNKFHQISRLSQFLFQMLQNNRHGHQAIARYEGECQRITKGA